MEFDFSPRKWMLLVMRHLRILRLILSDWHRTEKEISFAIRDELLKKHPHGKRLRELDTVKGYREVRYKFATKFLGKEYV